jgi:hypothetical protein
MSSTHSHRTETRKAKDKTRCRTWHIQNTHTHTHTHTQGGREAGHGRAAARGDTHAHLRAHVLEKPPENRGLLVFRQFHLVFIALEEDLKRLGGHEDLCPQFGQSQHAWNCHLSMFVSSRTCERKNIPNFSCMLGVMDGCVCKNKEKGKMDRRKT